MAQVANVHCASSMNSGLFDFAVLDAAACFDGGVSLRDLESLDIGKQAIEATALNLEMRGLARRTRSLRDRRAFALVATDWGIAVAASVASTLNEQWNHLFAQGKSGVLPAVQRLTTILLPAGSGEGDLLHRFVDSLLLFNNRFVRRFDEKRIVAPQALVLLRLYSEQSGFSFSELKRAVPCESSIFSRAVLSLQGRDLLVFQDASGQLSADSLAQLTPVGESLACEVGDCIARIFDLDAESAYEALSSLALLLDFVE